MPRDDGFAKVRANLDAFDRNFHGACLLGSKMFAEDVRNTMKRDAKWTDRSTNARNSLDAFAFTSGATKITVRALGGMSYSPFLEVRWGGKYAVIWPTLTRLAPKWPRWIKAATSGIGL
jgi:hypothetical protein